MAAALDASSAAAIRAEAIREARARRRAPPEDLSIAAAKRTLAGPASPATWRPRRLAERLEIDVGARRVSVAGRTGVAAARRTPTPAHDGEQTVIGPFGSCIVMVADHVRS